jgi:hypothetical protein
VSFGGDAVLGLERRTLICARQAFVSAFSRRLDGDGQAMGSERARQAEKQNLCALPISQRFKLSARENGEIIARIRNRCCYGGADWRHLGHAGARRRGRQAGQGKKRKRRPDARHNGGSH